jgi:hypothetical protein
MLVKAILYPLAVGLILAAGLWAWLSGAGYLILAALLLLIVAAVFRDLRVGHRAEADTKTLPAEETPEGFTPDAYGVRMGRIEERTRRILRSFNRGRTNDW